MELICKDCGRRFLFSKDDQNRYTLKKWEPPVRCPLCRKESKKRRAEIERRQAEDENKRIEAINAAAFDNALKSWNVIEMDDIHSADNNVLYIIGNGFDLMHGVKSSYYDFRDSLGKRNNLRSTLENFLQPKDIWADFEKSLGQFDKSVIFNNHIIDGFLNDSGVYDDDAGAAEYFVAIELSTSPIVTVTTDLPKRLRQWVDQLAVGTDDKPLQNFINSNGKVLCFNYTEFIETIYGVPHDNVCYIHGCRIKKKRQPPEELILGHMPSDDMMDESFYNHSRKLPKYRQAYVDMAKQHIIDRFNDHDELLTKDCSGIIERHKSFFDKLSSVKEIITIGHSLSEVDRDYFSAVFEKTHNAKWYFGCHNQRDLERIKQMAGMLGIDNERLFVFRTDRIKVNMLENDPPKNNAVGKEKIICTSKDGEWQSGYETDCLKITNLTSRETAYSIALPPYVGRGMFSEKGDFLFVKSSKGNYSMLIFKRIGEEWSFQSEIMRNDFILFNNRLKHIYFDGSTISFVYSNRVMAFDLLSGEMIYSRQIINAWKMQYSGQDLTKLL